MCRMNAILQARRRIIGKVERTPLLYSHALSHRYECDLYLKMECWQRCGCFKVRGAINAVSALTADERARGLITCSSGNHGLALAYAAELFGGAPVRIYVPEKAQKAKVDKIRQLGADVMPRGSHFLETLEAALKYAETSGGTFVHSHDDPLVIAGQGTIGIELLEQLPEIDVVVVPVGGGGLISGIASALKPAAPNSRVFGVEPDAAPGAWLSFRDGRCHERIELRPSVADGLCGTLTPRTFSIMRKHVETIELVGERDIELSMQRLLKDEQLLVEGSAAVGLAAIEKGTVNVRGKKTVIILTGRNIQATEYLHRVGN